MSYPQLCPCVRLYYLIILLGRRFNSIIINSIIMRNQTRIKGYSHTHEITKREVIIDSICFVALCVVFYFAFLIA